MAISFGINPNSNFGTGSASIKQTNLPKVNHAADSGTANDYRIGPDGLPEDRSSNGARDGAVVSPEARKPDADSEFVNPLLTGAWAVAEPVSRGGQQIVDRAEGQMKHDDLVSRTAGNRTHR